MDDVIEDVNRLVRYQKYICYRYILGHGDMQDEKGYVMTL